MKILIPRAEPIAVGVNFTELFTCVLFLFKDTNGFTNDFANIQYVRLS